MTSTDCVATPTEVTCTATGVTRVDIFGGPAGDLLFVSDLGIPLGWEGRGGGDDANPFGSGSAARMELRGGDGDDSLRAGPGPDLMDGGAGSDRFTFDNGDELIGGPDSDSLDNINVVNEAFHISLDGVANDGIGGPGTGNVAQRRGGARPR